MKKLFGKAAKSYIYICPRHILVLEMVLIWQRLLLTCNVEDGREFGTKGDKISILQNLSEAQPLFSSYQPH